MPVKPLGALAGRPWVRSTKTILRALANRKNIAKLAIARSHAGQPLGRLPQR
ncbi:hypothetical protein GCM10022254_51150 [Actinomadura meridiana]|uniref:Uncharacterized protein n=1 Tax=Actinomadura meridiana TaxID=559626 RepID=A0ABP8CD21_9ACTN